MSSNNNKTVEIVEALVSSPGNGGTLHRSTPSRRYFWIVPLCAENYTGFILKVLFNFPRKVWSMYPKIRLDLMLNDDKIYKYTIPLTWFPSNKDCANGMFLLEMDSTERLLKNDVITMDFVYVNSPITLCEVHTYYPRPVGISPLEKYTSTSPVPVSMFNLAPPQLYKTVTPFTIINVKRTQIINLDENGDDNDNVNENTGGGNGNGSGNVTKTTSFPIDDDESD